MVTNEQIRRARPTIDSPLGRLIKGEITKKQYEEQVREKRNRETDSSDANGHASQAAIRR